MRRSLPWVLAVATACAVPRVSKKSPGEPPEPEKTAAKQPAAPPAPAPKPNPVDENDPVRKRAKAFADAAKLLDKAAAALAAGQKSFAEQLFSSAELLVGAEALADLAPKFREGAPPRVETPPVEVPDQGAQPKAVGSSDQDEPDAKPERGSLAGSVQLEGKQGGGFSVVTLEPVGRKWKKRTPKLRVVEQRDRQFSPRVLAIPVGSTVQFPNYDPTFHNVFSTSDAKAFDLGLYNTGQAREVLFDKEGVIRIGCNLHANMAAFIIVVSAPHYAITDEQGGFKFASLRPGKYTLKVWSERSLQPVTQEIEIAAGENSVSVGVKADAPEGPAPDKFGAPRGKK